MTENEDRTSGETVAAASFVDFARWVAGVPSEEPPSRPREEVGLADLQEYLRTHGYGTYGATQIWMVLIERVMPELGKAPTDLQLEPQYETVNQQLQQAQLRVTDLKAMAEHLRPIMVTGYNRRMHSVVMEWISSL